MDSNCIKCGSRLLVIPEELSIRVNNKMQGGLALEQLPYVTRPAGLQHPLNDASGMQVPEV
jgi:hypothetical protein